ncbi:MAG: hypothetical protein ACRDQZ_20940 [Mycobacteriales bacterium]
MDVELVGDYVEARQLIEDIARRRGTCPEKVDRETQCCSFFTFTVSRKGQGVELDVVVPAAHIEVLDALATRVKAKMMARS